MGEYQACREVPAKVNSDVASNWTPPPPPPHERYKINVDGAVFASQKEAGLGVLVRAAEGRVVGACRKKIMAPLGALEIEAKAFEFGLHFAMDLLIQDFILEGDSLVLVNALKEISSLLSSPQWLLLCTTPCLLLMIFVRWIFPMFVGKIIGQSIYY